VRDRYGLKLISEVARTVLAEMELGLDRLRSNIDAVNRYQTAVFRRQIEAERDARDAFVSDRAFCNLAYTANHATVMHEIFRDPALEEYMRWVSAGLVFFVRPHPDLVQTDGVRTALRWEDVVLIDGMVKLLLEMYAIPYIIISELSMQERVRMVDEVIRLRYPELALHRPSQPRGEGSGAIAPMPRILQTAGRDQNAPQASRTATAPAAAQKRVSGFDSRSATREPHPATRDSQLRRAPEETVATSGSRDARSDLAPDS
jgi:hypothetical protein